MPERGGPAFRDSSMAVAGVLSAIRHYSVDGLIGGDLVQQVEQYGGIADQAASDLDGPHRPCFRIDPEVNLAPVPRLRRSVFLGKSFFIALHARAVDQEVQGAGAETIRDVCGQGLRSAIANQLPRWIHEVNPSSHLRKKADRQPAGPKASHIIGLLDRTATLTRQGGGFPPAAAFGSH